jgi:hypothetical protein
MLLERSTESWADLVAAFLVQRFYTLPVIVENIRMRNEPPQREVPADVVDQPGKFTFQITMDSQRLEHGRLLMWQL